MTVKKWLEYSDILAEKEAVASAYISEFKKELSDAERDILTKDLQSKLKEALISNDNTFDVIMKQFEGVLAESMKTRIKLFLQEKREILSKNNTKESLNKLKEHITANPSNPTFKEMWVAYSSWWVLEYAKNKTFEKRRNSKVDVKAIETSVDDMVSALQHKLKSAELTKPMKKELEQMIREVKSTKNYISSKETLSKWKKLVDAKILPVDLLKKVKISSWMKESLDLITKQKLTTEFVGKSSSEIKSILLSKNITNISDEVIDMLSKGKTIEHMDDIVQVISQSTHLSKFAKILGKFPVFDAAIIWYDWYNYSNSKKTEKDKVHFWITIAANLAGALGPILCTWPIGWAVVGTAVAADIAISHAVDVWYFDIREQFSQSKKDLAGQDIVALKQILVESFASRTWISRSSNEVMYDLVCAWRWEDDWKEKTAEDILSILIEQSEISLGKSNDLTKNPRIKQRLEYCKSYLPGGKNFTTLSQALDWSKIMKKIDVMLNDSLIYADMKGNTQSRAKNIEEYKKEQLWELEKENSKAFLQLEEFLKKDPLQASEFIHQVSVCAPELNKDYSNLEFWNEWWYNNIWWEADSQQVNEDFSGFGIDETLETDDYSTDSFLSEEDKEKQQKVKKMIDFVQRYMRVKSLTWVLPDVPMTDNKYLSTENMLLDLADGKSLQTYSQWQPEDFIKQALLDRNQSDQVENFTRSSDLRQNIIYRFAQSFHSYTWWNTMKELIEFFVEKNEWDANRKWLYYDLSSQQWMINDDYGKDQKLDFHDIENKSVDEIIKNRTTTFPNWMLFVSPNILTWWLLAEKLTWYKFLPKVNKDIIDTKTETPDWKLNQEFINQLRNILIEEKKFISVDYKKDITTKVMNYLEMTKPEEWKYIKLPWYLILESQQAWIWDLSECYFSFKEWKRKAITVNDRLWFAGSLPWVELQYITDKDWINNKKQLTEDELQKLEINKLSSEKMNITTTLQKIVREISMKNSSLSRIGRWKVNYDPITEQLSSWSNNTKISVINWWYILDDGKLKLKYKTAWEAIHIAMLKNRFDGKYKKEHPEVELKYQNYMGVWPKWLRDENTGFRWNDTRLLEESSIKNYFSTSFSEDWRVKQLLAYLKW